MSATSPVFSNCKALTTVNIGNKVKLIPSYAFYNNCTKLTSLTIPNSVTSIGYGAFYGCSRLASLTIPNSVTSIGERTFYNCSSLAAVTIPESVTSIGYSAFYGCSKLASVTIPNSVTSIGSNAFYDCRSLTSLTIPNSVESIGSNAFYGGTNLQDITLPFIGASANTSAKLSTLLGGVPSKLRKITVTQASTIAAEALSGCSNLEEVRFGANLTQVGERALYGCTGLAHIYVRSTIPPIAYSSTFEGVRKVTCTLHVPVGSKAYYQAETGWKDFFNIVEEVNTAINEIEIKSLNIYPNPAKDEISIRTQDIRPDETLQIVDLSGKRMYEGVCRTFLQNGNAKINVSTLPPGIYFVKAGNYTGKFVKE